MTEPLAITRQRATLYYTILVLINFVSSMGITTLYTMLATLYRIYDDPVAVGWAITSYLLVAAVAAALCGRLGDLLGRRRMVLIVIGFAGTGSLISAASPNLAGIIAGCALQGVAGAATPLAIGLARELLPTPKVPFAIGIISAAGMIGSGLAFLFAGFVIDHFGFQGGFVLKIVMAAIACGAVLLFVPRAAQRPASMEHIDLLHGILFAPAVVGVLLALKMVAERGLGDALVIAIFITALFLLAYWCQHQLRQQHPLINLRLLANRKTALANIAMICVALGCNQSGQFFSLFLQQPTWTQTGLGLSATLSGWIFLFFTSASLIASPWSGLIAARRGARAAAIYGALIVIAGWSFLIFEHSSMWLVIGAGFVIIFGNSFVTPAIYNLIIESTPRESTSEVAGMTYVFMSTGMSLGAQVLFTIMGMNTISDPAHGTGTFPSDFAYTLSVIYISLISIMCLVTLLIITGRQRGASTATA